jgi:adenylate kinase family enzyme
MIYRIHILGASGSGTTTLGRALAERLPSPHFDMDDYFWLPTDPPFTHQREHTERQQRLMDALTAHNAWVVSGSLCGWGDVAIPLFALVIFLWIPHEVRMERRHRREHVRFGERILLGVVPCLVQRVPSIEETFLMEQRISLITLGVRDLTTSRHFYEHGLGWHPSPARSQLREPLYQP